MELISVHGITQVVLCLLLGHGSLPVFLKHYHYHLPRVHRIPYIILDEIMTEPIFNVVTDEDSSSIGVLRVLDNCAVDHFYL
jgi:hypothetical protein